MVRVTKGRARATAKKLTVADLIKRVQPPKAGRPTKEAQRRKQFGWNPNASPLFKPNKGKIVAGQGAFSVVGAIQGLLKPARKVPTQPLSMPVQESAIPPGAAAAAAAAQEARTRARFIASRAKESREAIAAGDLMPSSVITALELPPQFQFYDISPVNIWVEFNGVPYTFLNVPRQTYYGWWNGNAACTTDDREGGMTGRHRKEWIIGKSPSLGAFYNQYIKNHFQYLHGWV